MSNLEPLMIRKRGAKVNAKQKKILLQFMADNPLIFTRKITPTFTIEHHKAFWQNMCAVLNIFGPPKKTVESWKKAWKDIRLRYRKAGFDVKEIIESLKCDNAVNTRVLLERADQIHTSCKGKVDVEQALRESILADSDNAIFLISNMDDPCENNKLNNKICNVKIEMNEAIFALESDNEDSNNENPNAVKNQKSDDNDDELCEVAYEEVLESDLEELHDSHTSASRPNSSTLKRKLDAAHGQYGIVSTDDDSDVEVSKYDLAKRSKLNNSPSITTKLFSMSNSDAKDKSKKDETSSSLLNELLSELRQHNRIQNEKLALKKKHFEQKKKLLEQSIVAKRDIAKAHILLAKSIKTFVDNISFNT